MRTFKPAIIILFFIMSLHSVLGQEIKINEVMSSNANAVIDEDGDSSDWIELYNSGQSTVNLAGFGLSDNDENPYKWTFPDVAIQPGEFLLIWASGKERAVPGAPLHTGFSIKAEGEELLLTSPDGDLIDRIDPAPIDTDVSFGRQPDGTASMFFFTKPTPGSSNNEETGLGALIAPPVFSHEGGFYGSPITITLTSSEPGTTIIYTTDGSDPDPANLSGTTFTYKNDYPEKPEDPFGELLTASYTSIQYTGPIPILDRSEEENVFASKSSTFHKTPWYAPKNPIFKGTVIKAKAVKEGAIASVVVAQTYFISEKTHNRYSLPVVSLSIQEEALFGYEKGIYVAGKRFDDWRRDNPQAQAQWNRPANFNRSGREWEYPAYMEVFEKEKGKVLGQNLGIRIHGGASTANPAKSIRLYARNEYGPTHLNYAFFPDKQDSTYKRLILRASGNDWYFTLFRDAALQSLVQHLNFETQAYQPSILFINGEYWGIHSFRERYDKYYLARVHSVDPEKVDILSENMVLDEGSAQHYQETIDYITQNSLAEPEHYQYVQTRIDVENFIDYQLAQIFLGNYDWPFNNIKYWRYQTNGYQEDAPKGLDGRWRWMMFDTDFGFGLYQKPVEENSLRIATEPNGPASPNPPWSTFLLRSLLENDSVRLAFVNRFTDQLNSAFLPEVTKARINEIKQVIQPEIGEHIARWKHPQSLAAWDQNVNDMLAFADQRPAHQREHLREYFDLGDDYQLEVNVSNVQEGFVKINSLELVEGTVGLPDNIYPWRGSYFAGIPIELEAVAAPGFVFVGWEGDHSSTSSKINLQPNGNIAVKAVFSSVPTGIKEKEKDFAIKCYPNPFDNETALEVILEHKKHLKVSLLDLNGKVHLEISDRLLEPGKYHFKIAASHLFPGVYIISCQVNGQSYYNKLVKY